MGLLRDSQPLPGLPSRSRTRVNCLVHVRYERGTPAARAEKRIGFTIVNTIRPPTKEKGNGTRALDVNEDRSRNRAPEAEKSPAEKRITASSKKRASMTRLTNLFSAFTFD